MRISVDGIYAAGDVVGGKLLAHLAFIEGKVIALKAPAAVLADMCHPHPSLSEAVWEACADAVGRPIHQI